MDLNTLIRTMYEEEDIMRISRNPLAQFGNDTAGKRYIGAEILPEMDKDANEYKEDDMTFRTVIADDANEYSPPVPKIRAESIEQFISHGTIDIEVPIQGRDYDRLLKMLKMSGTNTIEQARAFLGSLIDRLVLGGINERKEVHRWQAICNAQVNLVKTNGDPYTATLPNPAGHRYAAPEVFSDDTVDPIDHIVDGCDILRDLGYQVNRIISSNRVISIIRKNEQVKKRAGFVTVDSQGELAVGTRSGVSRQRLNELMEDEELPAIERYDLTYFTQTSQEFFLPRDVIVILGSTPRDYSIRLGTDDEDLLLQNTLGYYGMGPAQGQLDSGNVIKLFAREEKPVGLKGQGWAAGFPVIQEHTGIVVISGIR